MSIFKFLAVFILVFISNSIELHSQCTDTSLGDLDAKNLAYSPSNIYSCSKASVIAEWDVTSQWAYDADFHISKLIVSLPSEFNGLSASNWTITASDNMVYWDLSSATLTADEFQIELSGVIPTATNISIEINNMDVVLSGPFALFNVSQSVSLVIADCIPQNDEQTIQGVVLEGTGPTVPAIVPDCQEDLLAIDLTAAEGSSAISSYSWFGPNGFSSTDEDPSINVPESESANMDATGLYTVTVTDANGCTTTSSVELNPTNCAELPVELTSFTAESVELDAKLDWSTATEVNNEKFVIERSFGGKDFMEIATVSGAGNSTSPQHYNFVDEGVGYVTGKAYYRLKQVDYDGTFTYSDVRSVSFDNNSAISVYPTISTNSVNVEITDLDSQNSIDCKLVDQLGQVLKHMELSSNGTIDISTLPPAIYYLQIKDQRGTVDLVEKITKI